MLTFSKHSLELILSLFLKNTLALPLNPLGLFVNNSKGNKAVHAC